LIEKAEVAYALYSEDPVKFLEALRIGEIEQAVWSFIVEIDPWFRPLMPVPGMDLVYEVDGKPFRATYISEESQSNDADGWKTNVNVVCLDRESCGNDFEAGE
jgi:hypothetical protein